VAPLALSPRCATPARTRPGRRSTTTARARLAGGEDLLLRGSPCRFSWRVTTLRRDHVRAGVEPACSLTNPATAPKTLSAPRSAPSRVRFSSLATTGVAAGLLAYLILVSVSAIRSAARWPPPTPPHARAVEVLAPQAPDDLLRCRGHRSRPWDPARAWGQSMRRECPAPATVARPCRGERPIARSRPRAWRHRPDNALSDSDTSAARK
jgi:hypothetical protein